MQQPILVIDDEQDILDILEICLEKEGYEVKTASNTANISSLIKQHNPRLILLDYILNGVNGGEVCSQLKNNPQTSHIPVFLLSAYPKVIESFGSYGCDGFIQKPFDLRNLCYQINSFLNGRNVETNSAIIN